MYAVDLIWELYVFPIVYTGAKRYRRDTGGVDSLTDPPTWTPPDIYAENSYSVKPATANTQC